MKTGASIILLLSLVTYVSCQANGIDPATVGKAGQMAGNLAANWANMNPAIRMGAGAMKAMVGANGPGGLSAAMGGQQAMGQAAGAMRRMPAPGRMPPMPQMGSMGGMPNPMQGQAGAGGAMNMG